jgi:hypothetical protein
MEFAYGFAIVTINGAEKVPASLRTFTYLDS